MINLDEIKTKVLEDKELESVLQNFNWKEFEGFVAEIFRENGFSVKQNFRFATRNRYEIDLIAIKNKLAFCVDCKEWTAGRYKKSGLKNAVNKQENRVKELKKFLGKNTTAKQMLKIKINNFNSLMVTLVDEDLTKENNTIVLPVWKLNNFLLEQI